ncbi:MAG: hypothetical protein PUG96_04285 [Prevotellaceae bacterium]|nr:hypothetical protein [Prevotellaceae bacterium]
MKKHYFMIAAMARSLSLSGFFISCGSNGSDDVIEAIDAEYSVIRMEIIMSRPLQNSPNNLLTSKIFRTFIA